MFSLIHMLRLIFVLYIYHEKWVNSEKSFMISFQSQYNKTVRPSAKEWIEFKNEIPDTSEFTSCQWIRTKYYNRRIAINLWSYCTLQYAKATMECIQFHLHDFLDSASRNLLFHSWLTFNNSIVDTTVEISPFNHRAWNHFCWTFSSITGEYKVFYNGYLSGHLKNQINDSRSLLKNSNEMYDAAFIFGQEPDKMRGNFHYEQAFIGDLAELNVWNYILDDVEIVKKANCKDYSNGNVVFWAKSNIMAHSVIISNIEDSKSFCDADRRFVIFPERVVFPRAIEICEVYGGKIAAPVSDEEN